ncbi:hypothetical protein ZIOFF_035761 [Zingiber officinale]|uniref:Piwi domain-containing protein n=1 Tax=Zingiber officinale TaxID=94328 RepID=A0A8J5G9L9_ZINOF|nr:hypothetical protein ZIOFF_035761 [Zingiber officinale]
MVPTVMVLEVLSKSKHQSYAKGSEYDNLDCEKKIVLNLAVPSGSKMVDGGGMNSWTFINFAKIVQDNLARGFCHEFAQMCQISGMVGGRDTVLVDALSRCIPLVSDRPTIIFGVDVTHPHPGEDSIPSIAAVVASQDWPEVTKYDGLVVDLLVPYQRGEKIGLFDGAGVGKTEFIIELMINNIGKGWHERISK